MPLSEGQILHDRYRILQMLGKGGFGAVYKAWDTSLNIFCAVKENNQASEVASRQFAREANLLASLRHLNLPRVTDHFVIPGVGQYLVMDFIDGEDLQSQVNRLKHPMDEKTALFWIAQICDALTYLHSQNPPIIHRDIKPANIRITSQNQAILVDFGIAKVFTPNMSTTVGAKALTPGFSPPEQYGVAGRTDPRSDIYSLGATLYVLLTGHNPTESVERMVGTPLNPPHLYNQSISPYVENAILHSMEMMVANRFQSAEEFKNALFYQPANIGVVASTYYGTATQVDTNQAPAGTAQPALQPVHIDTPAVSSPGIPARRSSNRWIWLAGGGILVVGLIAVVCLGAGLLSQLNRGPRAQATATEIAMNVQPSIAPVLRATETPVPLDTPTFVPSPPHAILPPTPTPLPGRTLAPTNTPKPVATPFFGEIEICSNIDCTYNHETSFDTGTKAVFYRWSYQNMRVGVSYARRWYVNDNLYLDYQCSWGDSWPANGMFMKKIYDYDLGLTPGVWKVESYLQGKLQSVAIFTIGGAPRKESLYSSTCPDTSPFLATYTPTP